MLGIGVGPEDGLLDGMLLLVFLGSLDGNFDEVILGIFEGNEL